MRSKILFGVLDAVAPVMNSSQGVVEAQFAVIIRKLALVAVFDIGHGEELIVLRVIAIHIVLQGMFGRVILLEQLLTDCPSPVVGLVIIVVIHRYSRTTHDVVEL